MLKKIIFYIFATGTIICLAFAAILYWLVVLDPGENISQSSIERILAVESPVYYSDGQTKMGVFFEDAHRQYIPYARIPKNFINAIVAAEDRTFFKHFGIDFAGVVRAMIANIRAGRVVQGGSTITQQAAKNLFKRRDRSLRAKLTELLYAWRLEYHYPKEKILEFYVNQFYVSGNGRGLGVAARYYFDKPVEELDVLECAFIAGSVKRPNYYNPFIKKDEETAAKARKKAKIRAQYVLKQMYKIGMIDAGRYQEYFDREIPFQKGKMTYSHDTIMDLVKTALAEPEVEESLSLHGIDNIATSGLRVVTSIDKDLQEGALYSLRKELSRLDVRLKGYARKEVQEVYAQTDGGDWQVRQGGFVFGRIESIEKSPAPHILVSFQRKGKEKKKGVIDESGLMNLLGPLMKFQRHKWTRSGQEDLPILLERLKPGDLVYVSVREEDTLNGSYILDLEKYPEIQGGALVMRGGNIRALAGGVENRFYNRAISAKRPMGSVIKPLVYCAALQLGWNTMDILNNERNLFLYQKTPYFPRPDHESPFAGVSMDWAGVFSENVATVWLLYHLCDHLSPGGFKEVIAHLGLARRPEESPWQYMRRIRDEHGVVVDQKNLYRTAFEKAVPEIGPDLLFEGKLNEYETLRNFYFDTEKIPLEEDLEDDEAEVRQTVLERSFQRVTLLAQDLRRLQQEVAGLYWTEKTNLYYMSPASGGAAGDTGRYIYTESFPEEGWKPVTWLDLRLRTASMSPDELETFWGGVLVDGLLSVATVETLSEIVQKEYQRLAALPPYSPDVLHEVRDFRVLVALRYLIGLCREFGIESRLEPVLSFPLGSNVISLFEAARAYEGLTSGQVGLSGGENAGPALYIIDRIEDSDGEVVYSPKIVSKKIVSPEISLAINNVLRNVVKFGTGRYANRNLRLHSRDPEKEAYLADLDLGMPVIGKTGTANRFINSAFVGVVPDVSGPGNVLSVSNGYAVATYVGFDDNKPMTHKSFHVTGSAGALPVWTRLANTIFLQKDYAGKIDIVDISFSGASEIPMSSPDLGQITLLADMKQGGAVARAVSTGRGKSSGGIADSKAAATIVTFGQIREDGEILPTRFFHPYWEK